MARNFGERAPSLCGAIAQAGERATCLYPRIGADWAGRSSVVAAIGVSKADAIRGRSADDELSPVNCPVMSSAQGHEIFERVLSALEARNHVMDIDERRVTAAWGSAPVAIAA